MISPIFMAFAIIFAEMHGLNEIYHKVLIIEDVDDIYLTFLMTRRYEKNILLFKEEHEHISLFNESMKQLTSKIDNINYDYIVKGERRTFLALKDTVALYDGTMQSLLYDKYDKRDEETLKKMRHYAREVQKTLTNISRVERNEINKKISNAKLSFALSFVLIVIGVIIVSYLLARGIINTFKSIEKALDDINKDDNSGHYLDIDGPQEIRSFISAYNRTIAELTTVRAAYTNTIRKLEDANDELMHKQDEIIEKRNMAAMRLLSSEIAHEINNPLSSVISMLYMLYEEIPKSDAKGELVQLMIKDTNRCQVLIRALADFAKQQPLKLKEVNPASLVSEAVETVRRKLGPDMPYLTTYIEQLPPTIVVDPVLMNQVFVNILNNACQFTPVDGIIHIRGYTAETHVLFSIKDSGSGIPPEVISSLFEPFFSTRRGFGGTGLGLTISRKIIDRHRGSISVESVLGSGSVFKIKLPLTQDPV
ncbi:integral membrane sensor signal transduction histidine kinase [Candidatus Magnetobacterium bavaricum]|uniref:histidine kinase n=1 Tax=Candidatus Magnetobacterium bavaricum TaxID=29290 RepID=A0A0F3GSQ0_9BACT|nr:integral membrane sensor signal transduction histidine kinase [Candidatus Magnetobacterium bavaricum]